ncbi:MAG: hypothetical protein WC389_16155 [Lutibacter sp.]|jgi:uncharacterized protein YdaU (DUF1376 family)
MKDPAFLFYPNDYIGGTMGMTFEEKGAYMELLMMQFNRGHMTEHMIGQVIGQLWGQIKHKFTVDGNGLYFNERLEYEQKRRQEFSNSRKNNKLGINQYNKSDKKETGHMTLHMENRNRNENKDIIEVKNKKEFDFSFVELDYKKPFDEWMQYKKDRKENYKSQNSIAKFYNQLKLYSNFNPEIAQQIVDNSMSNNWAGIFKPKIDNNGIGTRNNSKINSELNPNAYWDNVKNPG